MLQFLVMALLSLADVTFLVLVGVAYYNMRIVEHEYQTQMRRSTLQLSYDKQVCNMRDRAVVLWTGCMLVCAMLLTLSGYIIAHFNS